MNGLKVLVKRREGSQTVAIQLYIRGGAGNLTTANAGVEAFMLNVASEASTGFSPRSHAQGTGPHGDGDRRNREL